MFKLQTRLFMTSLAASAFAISAPHLGIADPLLIQVQAPTSPEQERRIEEERKKGDEAKRQRGEPDRKRGEQEQQHQKAEQDKQRGEQQQHQKAEQDRERGEQQQRQRAEQDKQRGEQERRRAEQDQQQQRQKAEQEKQRGDQERKRTELDQQLRQKAEQDKQRGEQERKRTEQDQQLRQKAEQDKQRGEQERKRAEQDQQLRQKAEQDKQRGDQERKRTEQDQQLRQKAEPGRQPGQNQQGQRPDERGREVQKPGDQDKRSNDQAAQREGLLKRQLSDADRRAEQEREARKREVQALVEREKQQAAQERNQDQVAARLRAENERLKGLRAERRETRDERGQIVINEGNRTIYRSNNQVFIQHNEGDRLKIGGEVQRRQGPGGNSISLFSRRDGTRVEIEYDRDNRPLRRVRILPDGRRFTLFAGGAAAVGAFALGSYIVDLPPPRYSLPRDEYIVDTERASESDLYTAFEAPPVDPLPRTYSIDEVRASVRLRERMRSVNIDSINFEFGSFDVPSEQFAVLEQVAAVLKDIIDRNPGEVFLIEGHTDAVGSDVDNLSLSDRRAESVATVLSREFNVPAESLVTQGYGKQFLLIPTDGPERRNRRVVIRRITPLLTTDNGGRERR